MIRFGLAWILYLSGDLVWRVFDQWLPFIGLRWPLYRAYNWLMTTSGDVQGAGPGPWRPA